MAYAIILACCFVFPNPTVNPVRWGVLNLALATGDYESAHHVQGPSHGCMESNPLFGAAHPRRATFYERGLPVDFAIEAGGYLVWRRYHHRHHNLWRFPFLALSYSHAAGIWGNLSCP